jgi:hypothetical protein
MVIVALPVVVFVPVMVLAVLVRMPVAVPRVVAGMVVPVAVMVPVLVAVVMLVLVAVLVAVVAVVVLVPMIVLVFVTMGMLVIAFHGPASCRCNGTIYTKTAGASSVFRFGETHGRGDPSRPYLREQASSPHDAETPRTGRVDNPGSGSLSAAMAGGTAMRQPCHPEGPRETIRLALQLSMGGDCRVIRTRVCNDKIDLSILYSVIFMYIIRIIA